MLAVVADSQCRYNLDSVGLRVKTALTTAIYNKSLLLSNTSRKEKTGHNFFKIGGLIVFLNARI